MNKSIKKYMLQDLIVLLIIGLILEGLTERFAASMFNGTSTIIFGLFIVIVATARWNLWGLIVVPFIGFATWLGGSLGNIAYYADAYDWRVYISETVGLLTVGVNYLFFRGHKTRKVVSNMWLLILIIIIDYVLYCSIQFVVYRLCCSGNPFKMGELNGWYTYVKGHLGENGADNTFETITEEINRCYYIEQGFVYNLFGLAVALVGTFVLRSQGVIVNAVDKLIDDKKLAEEEQEYLKKLGNDDSRSYSTLAKPRIQQDDSIEIKDESSVNDGK